MESKVQVRELGMVVNISTSAGGGTNFKTITTGGVGGSRRRSGERWEREHS